MGFFAGMLVAGSFLRRMRGSQSKSIVVASTTLLVAAHAGFYGFAFFSKYYWISHAFSALASAATAIVLTLELPRLLVDGKPKGAIATATAFLLIQMIGTGAICLLSNLLEPVFSTAAVHTAFLACAVVLSFVPAKDGAQAASKASKTSSHEPACKPVKPPTPLVLIVVSFGGLFGFLHAAAGTYGLCGLVFDDFSAQAPPFQVLGLALAIAALIATMGRKAESLSALDVWLSIRRVVQPAIALGVAVPVLASLGVVATVFEQATKAYFLSLLLLGCFFMAVDTGLGLRGILQKGLLYFSGGYLAAVIVVGMLYAAGLLRDTTNLSLLLIAMFLLQTIGTYWASSDKDLENWWGVRPKLSAKRFHDTLLEEKCKVLAEEFKLTPRQHQILFLMAQGRRPNQVADELCISIHTSRHHIQNLYDKIGAHSFAELDDILKNTTVSVQGVQEEGSALRDGVA